MTRDSAIGRYQNPPGVDAVVFQTVLVVEDEPHIVEVVRDYLAQAGYRVLTAHDGQSALTLARHESPDLMILDLMLPGGMDGLDVCRRARQDPSLSGMPIIMLTARTEETDRLIGLELGADDYVTKPFSPREVVARVRAVLRRAGGTDTARSVVRVGDLRIDLTKRSVTIGGEAVSLTPTEFDLLAVMARSPGRPFTRAQLLDLVYDVAYDGYDRAIDSHVKNLRRKIEPDPRNPRYVVTVYGIGYRLADTDL
jgi:two-component system alkaline phosphatase synthesis response regulator PhoP